MALAPLIATVNVNNGEDVVTVTDQVLTPLNCRAGASVAIDGHATFVKALLSTTTFQITRNWPNATVTGGTAEIAPFTAEMASRVALSQELQNYNAALTLFEAYRRGFYCLFSAVTDLSPPEPGHVAFDSADLSVVTAMVISDTDANNQAQGARVAQLKAGDELTIRTADTGNFVTVALTEAATRADPEDTFQTIANLSVVESEGDMATDDYVTVERTLAGITSGYLYVAYASDNSGTDFSLTPDPALTYVAFRVSATEIETPTAGDFTGLWQKYIAQDGADGADGGGLKGIDVVTVDASGLDPATDYEAGQTVGGHVLVAGQAILRATPATSATDGVYICPASGAASRHPSFDTWDKIAGGYFPVLKGTFQKLTFQNLNETGAGTIDTNNLTFTLANSGATKAASIGINGAAGIVPLDVYGQMLISNSLTPVNENSAYLAQLQAGGNLSWKMQAGDTSTIYFAFGTTSSALVNNIEYQNSTGIMLFRNGGGARLRMHSSGAVDFPSISTTANAANAYVDSGNSNNLLRSTSTINAKTDIETMWLESARSLLALDAVFYRSKCKADIEAHPDWSYYGLIAEDVAAIDPRFVHFGYAEDDYEQVEVLVPFDKLDGNGKPVIGPDGKPEQIYEGLVETRLKPGAKPSPQGIGYERLTAPLLMIAKDHDRTIQSQSEEIAALKEQGAERDAQIAALEKRADAQDDLIQALTARLDALEST